MKRLRMAWENFFQGYSDEEESAYESADRTSREIKGSIFALLAVFELVALTSFVPVDSYYLAQNQLDSIKNLGGGVVGAYLAEWCLGAVGILGYSVLLLTIFLAYSSFRGSSFWRNLKHIVGGAISTVLAAMAAFLAFHNSVPEQSPLLGGWIGIQGGQWLQHYLHRTGGFLLLGGAFLIIIILTTDLSLVAIFQKLLGRNPAEERLEEEEEDELPAPKPRRVIPIAPAQTKKKSKKSKPKKKKKKKDDKSATGEDADDENLEEIEENESEQDEAQSGGFVEMIPYRNKYVLPSLRLLQNHSSGAKKPTRSELRSNARSLCEHLASFNITGEVETISVGPVITTYEFKPSAGVKLKSIANVQNDLGIALGNPDLRIVAPIPGKTVVGIEVPRATSEVISLKQIVSEDGFYDKKLRLPVALGKTTEGKPVFADLAAMPHLLVAGATGSGKSVFVNSLITGFIYRMTPQQLRLILIDPKMLELNAFEGLPHLISNVITNNNYASNALNWAVAEMENRYQMMAEVGSKNIDSYNAKMKSAANKLPYIVIVVDELADLMMTVGDQVEGAITRLAQKARAAGIHMVIATQRPSTDVITGLIKANIPSRLAFKVPSAIDSRTVLDASGAQELIGRGDSLMIRPATPMQRIHGCFVSEDELKRVAKHAKKAKDIEKFYIDFTKPVSE